MLPRKTPVVFKKIVKISTSASKDSASTKSSSP